MPFRIIFVFCFNKTGMTSMAKLFSRFGFSVGDQAVGENRPGIYEELDKAFPHSKFILTVRDTPEQWFDSLVRFHTKLFSSDKSRPPRDHYND